MQCVIWKRAKKDEKEAVEYFYKAANLGSMISMYKLGMCYLEGKGVAKDEQKAVECFNVTWQYPCDLVY